MRRVLPTAGVAAILAAAASPVFALRPPQPFFAGPYGPDGTWNVYEYVTTTRTFDAARADAFTRIYTDGQGVQYSGFLADVLTPAENAFLTSRRTADAWIGLTDAGLNRGATVRTISTIDGYEYQGTENSPAPSTVNPTDRMTGFVWITGQPVTYVNWNGAGEPNDWEAGEDAVELLGNGLWNDQGGGATMGEGDVTRTALVEYYVQAASNPIVIPRPASIAGGPAIANGRWGIREITGLPVGNVEQAEDIAAGTGGTRIDYQAPVVNIFENGGGNFGGDAPYATDTNPLDGAGNGQVENTVILANGRIRIPEGQGGVYTFAVNSDDGFRFEVVGKDFTSTAGQAGTRITGGIFEFPEGRGAQDSYGHVTLEPGEYDIQMVNWEGSGGASVEVFAAKGQHSVFNDEFALIGGTRTFNRKSPTVAPFNVVVEYGTSSDPTAALGTILDRLNGIGHNANTFTGTANTITFVDPESGVGQVFTRGNATAFPGDAAGDQNNFTMGARSTITVTPETAGDYSFLIIGDDQTQLRIMGTTGWQVINKADAVALADGMQDNGCCGDYIGHVNLQPGTYDLQVLMTEQVGGAGVGVYIAPGRLTAFLPDFFQPLGLDLIQNNTINGLQLVPEPGTLSLVGLGLAALGLRRRRAN